MSLVPKIVLVIDFPERMVETRPYNVVASKSSQFSAFRCLKISSASLKLLLNNRMAYVAVSRGAYDAQIFTNNREELGAALGHDVSHSSADAPEMKPEHKQKQEQPVTPQREQSFDFGLGL